MPNKVIVTGCSGFLGKALVHKLLEENHEVVGISRTNPNIPGLTHVTLDLTRDPLPKFEADLPVIHCAGLTQEGNSLELAKANVYGTRRALKLSTGRFIHISSSSIYDLSKPSIFTKESEAANVTRFYNEYSRTKHVADMLALADESRESKAIVLRPHAIYGPGDTTLMPRLLKRIHENKLTLPAGGDVCHNLTHINNMIQAIMLALQAPAETHGAFNITDADTVNLAEAMREITGSALKICSLPLTLAIPLGRITSRITPAGTEPKFSEYAVRQVGMNRTYDISRAKTQLGYNPTANRLRESYLAV